LDRLGVDVDIKSSVKRLDDTTAFVRVKPFYGSIFHGHSLPLSGLICRGIFTTVNNLYFRLGQTASTHPLHLGHRAVAEVKAQDQLELAGITPLKKLRRSYYQPTFGRILARNRLNDVNILAVAGII
jgi:hypothetical protein